MLQAPVHAATPCSLQPVRSRACARRGQPRLRASKPEAVDGDDIIGKAFRALFGSKARDETKPFGLQRLSGPALNAQYEASSSDGPAAAVAGDTADQAVVRPLLANTVLESAALRHGPLCWGAACMYL